MKHLFYLVITSLVLFSCTQSTKKFTDGTEYKIISDGNGKQIVNGNFIEVHRLVLVDKFKKWVLRGGLDILQSDSLSAFRARQPVEMFQRSWCRRNFKILGGLLIADMHCLFCLLGGFFHDEFPQSRCRDDNPVLSEELANLFQATALLAELFNFDLERQET